MLETKPIFIVMQKQFQMEILKDFIQYAYKKISCSMGIYTVAIFLDTNCFNNHFINIFFSNFLKFIFLFNFFSFLFLLKRMVHTKQKCEGFNGLFPFHYRKHLYQRVRQTFLGLHESNFNTTVVN